MKRLVQGIPSENDGALDSLVLCEPEPKAFYQFEERESTVFRRYGQDCRVHLTLPIDDIRIICRKMNLFEKFCVLRAVDDACFLPSELVRHVTQLLFRQFVYCQFCTDFIGQTLHVCMRCGDSSLICCAACVDCCSHCGYQPCDRIPFRPLDSCDCRGERFCSQCALLCTLRCCLCEVYYVACEDCQVLYRAVEPEPDDWDARSEYDGTVCLRCR